MVVGKELEVVAITETWTNEEVEEDFFKNKADRHKSRTCDTTSHYSKKSEAGPTEQWTNTVVSGWRDFKMANNND